MGVLPVFKNIKCRGNELITCCGCSLRLCICISRVGTASLNYSHIFSCLSPFVYHEPLL